MKTKLLMSPLAAVHDVGYALGGQTASECSGPQDGQRQTEGTCCTKLLISRFPGCDTSGMYAFFMLLLKIGSLPPGVITIRLLCCNHKWKTY